jgi:hypothetical protein
MATLIADPNMGVAALWQRGVGAPVALRLLRSSPDVVQDAFSAAIIQATDVLEVPAAFGTIEPGDTFTIGADVLTVLHVERDAIGVAQRVTCRR